MSKKSFDHTTWDRLVQTIFDHHNRIRYCAMLGEGGQEIAGAKRPGVGSLESGPEGDVLRLFIVAGLANAETLNTRHGDTDLIIVHRRKVMLFVFPCLAESRPLVCRIRLPQRSSSDLENHA